MNTLIINSSQKSNKEIALFFLELNESAILRDLGCGNQLIENTFITILQNTNEKFLLENDFGLQFHLQLFSYQQTNIVCDADPIKNA